jgi:hypothetical protein
MERMLSQVHLEPSEFHLELRHNCELLAQKNGLPWSWPLANQEADEESFHPYSVLRIGKPSESEIHSKLPCKVLLSAGLHGVEGRFGVVLLLTFLSILTKEKLGHVTIDFVFVLNSIGFFHCRRTGLGNADLNRAFILKETQTN